MNSEAIVLEYLIILYKFSADSEYVNAARGLTGSTVEVALQEFLDCLDSCRVPALQGIFLHDYGCLSLRLVHRAADPHRAVRGD